MPVMVLSVISEWMTAKGCFFNDLFGGRELLWRLTSAGKSDRLVDLVKNGKTRKVVVPERYFLKGNRMMPILTAAYFDCPAAVEFGRGRWTSSPFTEGGAERKRIDTPK